MLIVFGLYTPSHAQLSCPENIDFELGNYTIWQYYTGTCCPIVTPTPGRVAGRHDLTSGGGVDGFGGFPIVAPGGGFYSLKVGNSSVGAQAEKARYYIHVPTTATNYSLVYRYAVVFEDPGHGEAEQPRFEVTAYDSATGVLIPCAEYTYVAGSSLPGFSLSAVRARTYFKTWTTSTINLSGLGGTTVGIDFASGDCDASGHFGYGYIDMSCGLFAINSIVCDTLSPVTMMAPEGFASYEWYDSATYSILMGTSRTISIPLPGVPTTYAVIIRPYVGFGCPDTLFTSITPAHMLMNPSPNAVICRGDVATISAGATDIALPLTYNWSPATGLGCSTCDTTSAAPAVTTVYTVTVTNKTGCSRDTTVTVHVLPQVISSIVDVEHDTCFGYNNGNATVRVTDGTPPYTYYWNSSPPQYDTQAVGLYAGAYQVVITDITGCRDTQNVTINEPPPTIMRISSFRHPDDCGANTGSIVLAGLFPDSVFIVKYQFNGRDTTVVLRGLSDSTVVLTGLRQGLYDSIQIIPTHCPYNIVGPLRLTDPLPPAIPVVFSNTPVCENGSLNLYASSSTTGADVFYRWDGPMGYASSSPNPVIGGVSMGAAGVYSVSVWRNNCYVYSNTAVVIKPLPLPVATNNSPICSGETLNFFSSSSNGASYFSWRGPGFGFAPNVANPTIDSTDPTAAGTYTVTITLNGCSRDATTNVIVNTTPVAPVTADLEYCQYDVAPMLTATGSNLSWYTTKLGGTGLASAPTPSTAQPGKETWYVEQTSIEGCVGPRSPISVTVYEKPNPFVTITDSVICTGKYVTLGMKGNGQDNIGYTWIFAAGDSVSNQNPVYHVFPNAGTFTVTATAYQRICQSSTLSKVLKVGESPIIDLGNDTAICPGNAALVLKDNINVTKNATWKWNNGSSSASITVVSPGTYYAVVAIEGCTTTDSVLVVSDCYVSIPNVFSPDGDGINDFFFPRQYLTRGITGFAMTIYNRWGQLMFETAEVEGRGWDGKLNGVAQPQGVYIYSMDVQFKDGQKEHHQGNITLLR